MTHVPRRRMRNLGGYSEQCATGSQLLLDCIGESPYGVHDFVPTPAPATDGLVASRHPPPPDVLDPFAGNGAILRRLIDHGWDPKRLHAVELRDAERPTLELLDLGSVIIGNWFEVGQLRCSISQTGVVTNVPWSILVRCMTSILDAGFPYVASLQPLEELGGVERADWLNKYTPCALVSLRKRMFPKAARGVAWNIWKEGLPQLDFEVR